MINAKAGILLRGVVGSTAFGLARPGSDKDYLGIFAAPVRSLHFLDRQVKPSIVRKDPDETRHEVGKYMALALKCNPTIMDLMYLPEYDVLTDAGQALIDLRYDFLSEKYVRSAYGGYALGQIKRIQQEWRNGDRPEKIAKHARHCFRLLEQGQQLLETGTLTVRVKDPLKYWAFDHMSAEEVEQRFLGEFYAFNGTDSILPPEPRVDRLQALLYDIRGI